jgi:hypothetical protein
MANPKGQYVNSSDREIWETCFQFTTGASGAVTAASFSSDISGITRSGAGTYVVALREKWAGLVGYDIHGITTTVNAGQISVNNVGGTTPSFTFVTLVETGGAQAAGDLTATTVVIGRVALRNSNVR